MESTQCVCNASWAESNSGAPAKPPFLHRSISGGPFHTRPLRQSSNLRGNRAPRVEPSAGRLSIVSPSLRCLEIPEVHPELASEIHTPAVTRRDGAKDLRIPKTCRHLRHERGITAAAFPDPGFRLLTTSPQPVFPPHE